MKPNPRLIGESHILLHSKKKKIKSFFEITLTLCEEDILSDSHRVGMAAPRPIKGILKNKNSAPNVKPVPDDVQPEKLDKAPGLSEDDQQ